jgi:hypothetical protein
MVAWSCDRARQMEAPDFDPELNLQRATRIGSQRIRMEARVESWYKIYVDSEHRLMEAPQGWAVRRLPDSRWGPLSRRIDRLNEARVGRAIILVSRPEGGPARADLFAPPRESNYFGQIPKPRRPASASRYFQTRCHHASGLALRLL